MSKKFKPQSGMTMSEVKGLAKSAELKISIKPSKHNAVFFGIGDNKFFLPMDMQKKAAADLDPAAIGSCTVYPSSDGTAWNLRIEDDGDALID
jgi:hypothetical protein